MVEELDATASSDLPLVEINALLGRGTRYKGDLMFDGRTRIEGAFEGTIRGEVLVIGEGAHVNGDIEVDICIVTGGQVEAEIRARESIELHAPAIVIGDLHAPNVFIDRGVRFEGGCKMAPLEEREGAPEPDRDIAVATTPVESSSGAEKTTDGATSPS
ncbi:MAG: polymer-forming cytoskeletal protein [Myxococcota bacterium]